MERFVDFFSDHFVISSIWIFLFIAVVYVTFLCWFANFSEISCHRVIWLINQKGSVIIDVRDQENFYQGCIINSIHLCASDIRASCGNELCKFKVESLILVCSDGVLSCSIARYLCKLGFKNIYVLKGGINAWNNESLPLVVKKRK